MTTKAIFTHAATTFPEVASDQRGGAVAYTIRGKVFAALTDDGLVELWLPQAEATGVLEAYPSAQVMTDAGRPTGVAVALREVDGQYLWSLTMAAWKHRAPKRLAAMLTQVIETGSHPDSDLPASIGKAATRALLIAGLITLDDVATKSQTELAAMHGVGPKAVRILAEAIAERGGTLRES